MFAPTASAFVPHACTFLPAGAGPPRGRRLLVQVFQARSRATPDQELRHVGRESPSRLHVGQVPLSLLPLAFCSLQSRTLFCFDVLLVASLFGGVGGVARLLHLFGVRAQLVQFRDHARLASFTRIPGRTLFAFDALHDLPEFAGNTPCSFAGCLFAPLSYFVLPQPFCRFADSRKALLRSAAPVVALLLSFEFALPDQFSNVLKSFARSVGTIELIGANQLELSRNQRPAELECARCVGSRQHLVFEPPREILGHCS